jgi:hypothetical protein
MKATDMIHGSSRRAGLIVATSAVALLASLLGGTARAATDGTAALCPPAGALATYSQGGAVGGKSIIVQADGRVWVCWAGRGPEARIGFVLTKAELNALRVQLRVTDVRHLGLATQQTAAAAAAAVHRAELMIDMAAEKRIAASVAPKPDSGAAAVRRAGLMIDLTAEQLIAGA